MTPLIGASAFSRQWSQLGGEVLETVAEVGASGWYVLGSRLAAFEKNLAAAVGRRAAIGVGNGLDALEIALRALGLKPGEWVMTSPLSAFATSLAILRAGGVPLYVDCDASGLLDLAAARICLEQNPKIRFCIPVHLYGFCLDLEELARLRDDFQLKIVEDGAQALGAGWQADGAARQVGDAGQVLATSFYPTKNLGALGDGGAVFTDDPALEEKMRRLRDYGQSEKYLHTELGLNSRLDELHAAILDRAMLPRWPDWNTRRREIAERYLAGIAHPHVAPLPVPANSRPIWHLFPVRVKDAPRQALLDHLRSSGVLGLVHYPMVMPDQPCLGGKQDVAIRWGALNKARALAKGEVSLPITPDLTEAEVDQVVEAVNSWRP